MHISSWQGHVRVPQRLEVEAVMKVAVFKPSANSSEDLAVSAEGSSQGGSERPARSGYRPHENSVRKPYRTGTGQSSGGS